jgi:hypothetical protein
LWTRSTFFIFHLVEEVFLKTYQSKKLSYNHF